MSIYLRLQFVTGKRENRDWILAGMSDGLERLLLDDDMVSVSG